ncbi:MAG: hypothetical protein V2A56_04975, partial [bacterium]
VPFVWNPMQSRFSDAADKNDEIASSACGVLAMTPLDCPVEPGNDKEGWPDGCPVEPGNDKEEGGQTVARSSRAMTMRCHHQRCWYFGIAR